MLTPFNNSSENRRDDRLEVLAAVEKSIETGMGKSSVDRYIGLAKGYGRKYGISSEIEAWILGAQNGFSSKEEAELWAKTLP